MAHHHVLVNQLGLASPKRPEPRVPVPESEREKVLPFFPNYLVDELVAWYVILAVLVVLSSLFPAGLEGQANPLLTPEHTKPEWYYLSVYQLLKDVPIKIVGIMTPIVGIGVLVIWPFLDRNPEVLARRRKLAVAGATLVLIATIALTVQGFVS
jgi:quinol-cytochrome oxidoreductase complex cytochrome b subunit